MDQSNGTIKVLGALLIGAATGAALGILLAPAKGSDTRKRIIKGANGIASDIKQRIQDEAEALRTKASELEEMVSDKVHDLSKKVTDQFDHVKA